MEPIRMISWRRYQAGDLNLIPRSESEPFSGWSDFIEENGRGMATIVLGGDPLVVFGCISCWDGVAEAFATVNREMASGHGKAISRMIRARMDQCMEVLSLHRMQATAGVTDRQGQVFLRAIGFSREGLMREGAPDRTDLITYAYIRADK